MRRVVLLLLPTIALLISTMQSAHAAPQQPHGCVREHNVWWDDGLWVHVETNVNMDAFCVDGRCIKLVGPGRNALTLPLGKKNAYILRILCGQAVDELNAEYFPVDVNVDVRGPYAYIFGRSYARCKETSLCALGACDENSPFFLRVPAKRSIVLTFRCDGRETSKSIELNIPAPRGKQTRYGILVPPRRVGRWRIVGKTRVETEGNVFELILDIPVPPQVEDIIYVEGEGNTLRVRLERPGTFTVWKYTGDWNYLGTHAGSFELNVPDNSPLDLDPTPNRIVDPIGVGTGGLTVSADVSPQTADVESEVRVYGSVEKNGTPLANYWVNIFLDGNRLGGPTYMVGPSDWWDPRWRYRREINISNPDGVDVNGVDVPIELNLLELYNQGKLRRDAGDLRFVDRAGNVLEYWIESKETTINAVPVAGDDTNAETKDADCDLNPIYTYLEVNDTDGSGNGEEPAGWYLPDFNDDAWAKGSAPFGNTGGECTTVLNNPPQDLFVRKWFEIPGEPIEANVYISVGGGVRCYLNGALVLDDLNADNNASYWNYTIPVDASLLKEGPNLLACWIAVGGENAGTNPGYFDAEVNVAYYERILPDVNVWVKVDVPAAGTTIYMYYGNPDAQKMEDYSAVFYEYATSKSCSGSSRGGSCSVTFDPAGDLGFPRAAFVDQRYGYGTMDMLMSGDFADNESGEYADVSYNGILSGYVGRYYTGADGCTDVRAKPYTDGTYPEWPMDASTWMEGASTLTMTGDSGPQVDYNPGCGYYYKFTWDLNSVVAKLFSGTPSVSVGPEMQDTSTDAYGKYSWTFTAPDTPGEHNVAVEVNDGTDFARVVVPLFVRRKIHIYWADVLPRLSSQIYSVYVKSSDPNITDMNLTVADANNTDIRTVTCTTGDYITWLCDLNVLELNKGQTYILKAKGYVSGALEGFDAKYTVVDSAKVEEFSTERDVNSHPNVLITPSKITLQGILAGFAYRRPIVVRNNTYEEYNDVPVKVVVDTQTLISEEKMKSDCSDVRFTDEDGVTELPYWLERGCNTASTVFWVKVPRVEAMGDHTIYMYYGNPRAPPASDGHGVFLFFDDFEEWNGWVQYSGGVVQQSNLDAWDGAYSLLKTTNNDPNGGYRDIGFELNFPFILEAEIKRINFSGGPCDRIGVIDNSGNGYGPGYCHNSSTGLFIDRRDNYSGTVNGSNDTGADIQNQWYKMVFIWDNGTMTAEYFDSSGNLQASTTYTDNTYTSFTRVYVFGGHDYLVDDIRIRRYYSNPPTATVGAEESVPSVPPTTGNWLGGFSYRDPVKVENEAGDLRDFQVKVVVDTQTLISEGKMKSDCSDVRFTDEDGVTELPYWLERGCNTASTVFWVKVPDLPQGTKTLYMYYGNASASSASDPRSVFDFWEDFEEWNGWVQYGSGVVQQYCDDAWEGSCSLLKTANNDPNGGYKDIGFVLSYPFVLESYVKRINYNGGSWDRTGVIDDSGNGYGAIMAHSSDSVGIDVRTNYSASTQFATAATDPEYRWYLQRLIWNRGEIIAQVEEANGEGVGGTSLTDTNYSQFTRVYVFGGQEYLVDAMRIRKYAEPFPKAYVQPYEPRYAPTGYVEFKDVDPYRLRLWKYIEANIDDVRDTKVHVDVYSGANILCSFDLAPNITEYDIAGCAESNAPIHIRVTLSTDDPHQTPVLRFVKLSWIEDANILLVEPTEQYLFRNSGATARGWLTVDSDCADVNAYLYYRQQGVPRTIEEFNYDHFITRSADENVHIGDALSLEYTHPELGYFVMDVNISNPAGADLYDYAVKVVIDTETLISQGRMREDCGDIRVVDENYVELNYWVKEGTCNTKSTEVWVLVPHIPPSGTVIHIFHGRLEYTSKSNPDAVFPESNTLTGVCEGSTAGGVCSTTLTPPAGKAIAPYFPPGYGMLKLLMSGDFDYGGAIGDPDLCDPDGYERTTFYVNGTCVGTYSPGQQDCTPDPPPNTPIDVRNIVAGAAEVNIDGDAGSAVNYDPRCGYYYHYEYELNVRLRNYVSPEPVATVRQDRPATYDSGYYISDALDTGIASPGWGTISWTGDVPAFTTRNVYVRTSPDGTTWSDWYAVDNGDVIPAPSARYIQYKVVFTLDPRADAPPTFDDLRIVYYEGSAGWTLASPTAGLVTLDDNPYRCGDLLAGQNCEPLWSITPKQRGEYRLIMQVKSGCGFEGYSNEKVFYSFAPTTMSLSADKNVVAKGDSLTLSGSLVDELGNPVARRVIYFYDEGTYIGETTTDDYGNFTFTYTVPLQASIGYHTITAKFPRDSVEFYWESNASVQVKYSSKPVIHEVNVIPSIAGIGDVVHVSAYITDEVGVSTVELTVTDPENVTYTYDMNGGPVYEANVEDTWKAGTYVFTIRATNLDGVSAEYNGTFRVEGYATYGVQVEKNAYGALEDVLLSNDPYWANPMSTYRALIDGEGWYGSDVSVTVDIPASADPFGKVSSYEFLRLDGSEVGSVTYGQGVEGNALVLSGSGYVGILATAALEPKDGITWSAWLRVDSNVGDRYALSLTDTAGNTIYAIYSPAGDTNVCFALRVGTGTTTVCSPSLGMGSWHHVLALYDGGMVRLYVDGNLSAYAYASGDVNYQNASEIMTIGGVFTGTGFSNGWVGGIDEVRMYPFPLSDKDVSALYRGETVLRNPNGYWPMEGDASDAHPYKENALIVNSRTSTDVNVTFRVSYIGVKNPVANSGAAGTDGKEGNAAYFDGSAYLTVDSVDFDYINTFTVAFWVYPEANSGTLVEKGYPSNPSWRIGLTGSGELVCTLRSATGNEYNVGYPIQTDAWSHVACVYNRFSLMLYVNGSEVNSANVPEYGGFTNTSDVNVGSGFVGKLDELSIYHAPLAKEDIQRLYSGKDVPWGISFRISFDGNWEDTSGDWLIPIYSGGWDVVERTEARDGAPITLGGNIVATEKRSAICNIGETNVSGYLYVDVQTGSGSTWSTVPPIVINDVSTGTRRTIPPGTCLDIASIFNASPWNTDNQPAGTYRVRMAFLARGGSPSDTATYITLSSGDKVTDTSEFNIISATLSVSDINHAHLADYNLNEYETTDTIDWIDVYVTARDSTALDVNVMLTLTDQYKYYAGFGPNKETKYYGDIPKDSTVGKRWDNGGSGYYIPEDASPGTYQFYWLVEMNTANGPSVEDFTRYVVIHNLPADFNSSAPTRIYYYDDRNGWGIYEFCMENPWSRDINDVNVYINCPSGVGIICEGVTSGTGKEGVASISSGGSACFDFNIIVTPSAVSGDYNFDVNVEYVNPATHVKRWDHQQRRVIEIRKAGILEIILDSYPTDVVRGEQNAVFISKAHNTGTVTDENAWIAYSYPSDWTVAEANTDGTLVGDVNAFKNSVPPDGNIELNVAFSVPGTASLGPQLVRITTGTATNPDWGDFKNVYVTVWDRPSLTLDANDYNASVGETILLHARLAYSDGSPIPSQRVNFEKNGTPLGADTTDTNGDAFYVWDLSTESPGTYIVTARFEGNSDIYVLPAEANIVINVGLKPDVNAWLSDTNVGYGMDVNVEANVTDDQGIKRVWAVVREPDGNSYEVNMTNDAGIHYYATIAPWKEGEYNITVYAQDLYDSISASETLHLYATAWATIGVETDKNVYAQGDGVNLVGTDWWNVKWKYRRKITVTNNTGSALSGYVVRVVLDTNTLIEENKVRYDLGDIRFVDGTQELNYWFQETEATEDTIQRASDDTDPTTADTYCSGNPTYRYYYCYDVCLPTDWYKTTYDDSSWSTGSAPFGNTGGECTTVLNNPPDDLFVRKWVEIPGEVLDANLYISVGGGVRCYVNDTLVLDQIGTVTDATYWNYEINVQDVLHAGDNLIACWVANGGAENAGGATGYFDAQLRVKYVPYKLTEANFWVKVDLPAGEKNIYVYYGNPQATHVNDPSTVFTLVPEMNATCTGSAPNYTCSATLPADTTVVLAPYQDPNVEMNLAMGGDLADNETGEYGDVNYDSGVSSGYVGRYYTGQDACGPLPAQPYDATSPSWPINVYDWIKGAQRITMYGTSGPQVDYDPGCGYYILFVWTLLNAYVRPYASPEPTASVGDEETLAGSYVLPGRTFKGYILAVIERNESGTWTYVDTDVNDASTGTERTFAEGALFDLSSVWSEWNTYGQQEGEYRVRVTLTDPYGHPLTHLGAPIEEWNTFYIGPPPVDVNISDLKVFDVNGVADPRTEGNLVDSGLEKTIYLPADRKYRFEIHVAVTNGEWNIADSNVIMGEINALWDVSDIWYTLPSGEDMNGGTFDGNVEWNTANGGSVSAGLTVVFNFIVDLNTGTEEEHNAIISVTHPSFIERSSWVDIQTYVPDTTPPYAVEYNLTNIQTGQTGWEINAIRSFDDVKIYAEWNETIDQAYVEFNGTSSALTTDTITPDGNYTEYVFDITSFWLLGPHVAKIHASDLSGNWNDDLNYLTFYVWGIADVSAIDVNDANVYVGDTIEINCTVVDRTDNNAPVPNYPVRFYDNGAYIGTATTNTSGVASISYTFTTFGDHTLECNVDINTARWYLVDPPNNEKNTVLFVKETVPPEWNEVNYTPKVHRGEALETNVHWTDNHLVDTVKLVITRFKYRRDINIENNWGALSGAEIPITVDTASLIAAGKMRSDCGDVRFYDGSTKLPYYLEPGTCNTASTTFWVKLDLPVGTKKITMYYGNPDAVSESNGHAVFHFFDDFEEWNGWVQYGSGQVSQDTTRVYEGNYSLHKTTASDPNGGYKDMGTALGRNIVLEAWINRNSGYAGGSCDRIGIIDSSGNGYGFGYCHDSTTGLFVDVRSSYSGTVQASNDTGADIMDDWYFARLIVRASDVVAEYYYGGSLEASTSYADTAYSSFSRVYVFGGYDYWVDLMRVRLYYENVSVSVGPEESASGAPGILADTETYDQNDVWAYLTWLVPSTEPLGAHHWYQEANDPSGNVTDTNTFDFNVWGWAHIDSYYASPTSLNPDQNTTLYCHVEDRDTNNPLANYDVNFYWDTTFLGAVETNADGWAWMEHNVDSDLGQHQFRCVIGSDANRFYDPYPGESDRSVTINVTTSSDTDPPDAVEWNVVDMNTGAEGKEINVYRGDDLNFWAVWDENLSAAWVEYSPDGVTDANTPANVDGNRAEAVIRTTSTWTRGRHPLLMRAQDEANNISIDANSADVNVYVWALANVEWVSPTGTVNRDRDMNAVCRVYEGDTNAGIAGYTVYFYSDLGGGTFLGTADTNADGYATLFVDLNDYYGNHTFWCQISDWPAEYYEANVDYDSETIYVAALNLKAVGADVNDTSPVEGAHVEANFTVWNQYDETNAWIEVNVQKWDGSSWTTLDRNVYYASFGSDVNVTFRYVWTAYPGRYRFLWTADFNNVVDESNEADNAAWAEVNVPTWTTIHGEVNLAPLIGAATYYYYKWSGAGDAVLVYDSDYEVNIDRITGMSGVDEVNKADYVLGTNGNPDCILCTFAPSGELNYHVFTVGNREVNAPYIDVYGFPTGIAYDDVDRDGYFDSTEPIVFITEVYEGGLTCPWGTCEYVIKVPSPLKEQDPTTGSLVKLRVVGR